MIKETKENLAQILFELDTETTSGRSVDQVMELLLGRKSDYTLYRQEKEKKNQVTMVRNYDKIQEVNNPDIWRIEYNHPIYPGKPILGGLFRFVKRCIRFLIRPIILPIIEAQNEFNASSVRAINELHEGFYDEINFLYERLCNENLKIKQNNENQIRQLERMFSLKTAEMESEITSIKNEIHDDIYDVLEYEKFEKLFRGKEDQIRRKQEEYLPYFIGRKNVVDLGCGRGEFLQLLKENNIAATGVEKYGKFAETCVQKGLNVFEEDALNYMSEIEDGSIDAVVAFQLVEHLKPSDLVRLCNLAYDKLEEGGIVIFETPNPKCLSIYTNAFYMDCSHQKPVHPETLKYFLESSGFSKVDIIYTESSRVPYRLPLIDIAGVSRLEEYNDAINGLTDLIWGSQDYAVVATK